MSMHAMVELVSISCLVKGVKFYEGQRSFSSFDNVILVREPSNPFDTNSVLVKLANNLDVLGHLERSVAAELMDKFEYQVKIIGYVECHVTLFCKHV